MGFCLASCRLQTTEDNQPQAGSIQPSPSNNLLVTETYYVSTPCAMESYDFLCSAVIDLPDTVSAGVFAVSPTGEFWIVVINDPRADSFSSMLIRIDQNGSTSQINLSVGVSDMVVSDSGIWIYDLKLLPDLPKVYHLDTDGSLIAEVEIPREFLLDSSNEYQETGIDRIRLGVNNEIILSGVTGTWQLFNWNGDYNPLHLDGLPCGPETCRVVNDIHQGDPHIASLFIGEKQVDFSTDKDYIFIDIIQITGTGEIYVVAKEGSLGVVNSLVTLYKLDLSGSIQEYAHVLTSSIEAGPDNSFYNMVVNSLRGTRIFQVEFLQK